MHINLLATSVLKFGGEHWQIQVNIPRHRAQEPGPDKTPVLLDIQAKVESVCKGCGQSALECFLVDAKF